MPHGKDGTRTRNLSRVTGALYQLSYHAVLVAREPCCFDPKRWVRWRESNSPLELMRLGASPDAHRSILGVKTWTSKRGTGSNKLGLCSDFFSPRFRHKNQCSVMNWSKVMDSNHRYPRIRRVSYHWKNLRFTSSDQEVTPMRAIWADRSRVRC